MCLSWNLVLNDVHCYEFYFFLWHAHGRPCSLSEAAIAFDCRLACLYSIHLLNPEGCCSGTCHFDVCLKILLVLLGSRSNRLAWVCWGVKYLSAIIIWPEVLHLSEHRSDTCVSALESHLFSADLLVQQYDESHWHHQHSAVRAPGAYRSPASLAPRCVLQLNISQVIGEVRK